MISKVRFYQVLVVSEEDYEEEKIIGTDNEPSQGLLLDSTYYTFNKQEFLEAFRMLSENEISIDEFNSILFEKHDDAILPIPETTNSEDFIIFNEENLEELKSAINEGLELMPEHRTYVEDELEQFIENNKVPEQSFEKIEYIEFELTSGKTETFIIEDKVTLYPIRDQDMKHDVWDVMQELKKDELFSNMDVVKPMQDKEGNVYIFTTSEKAPFSVCFSLDQIKERINYEEHSKDDDGKGAGAVPEMVSLEDRKPEVTNEKDQIEEILEL